jgi:hypothetical protein
MLNITYSLVKLRDLIVQRGTPRTIPLDLAYIIRALDAKNEFCFVETPSSVDNSAYLWHITDWLECSVHREKLKYESELYRQRSYANTRNLDRLVSAYRNLTSFSKEEAVEQCSRIMRSPYAEATFKTLHIKFESVTGLDPSTLKPIIQVNENT